MLASWIMYVPLKASFYRWWGHTLKHTIHKLCILYTCWSLLYKTILCSWADSLRSHVTLHEWLAFYSAFVLYPLKWCTYSTGMAGATWNCCPLGMFCVYHTTMHAPCHFTQSHIHKVYACLAVTCHLHFSQNDWDLLHATAVTQGVGVGRGVERIPK